MWSIFKLAYFNRLNHERMPTKQFFIQLLHVMRQLIQKLIDQHNPVSAQRQYSMVGKAENRAPTLTSYWRFHAAAIVAWDTLPRRSTLALPVIGLIIIVFKMWLHRFNRHRF